MIDLSGRTALVCGATRGIGRACAELLAKAGARVTLVARDAGALERVAEELCGVGASVAGVVCANFSSPESVRDAVTAHIDAHGPHEILINNTGGPPSGPLVDAQAEQFLAAIRMHVVCNQLLVQALLPGMRAARYGRIVNIVSTSVREPIPGLGVSNTTRAAVAGWSKTLSRELAPDAITINNVLPGFTATERLRSLFEARAQREGRATDAIEDETRRGVPMGRFARPEEIAAAVVFLASPLASYITGVSLAVDGGRLSSI